MNQIYEPITKGEVEEEVSDQSVSMQWRTRILAILLLLIFLTPICLSAVQMVMRVLDPQNTPTPFRLENLLFG
jgi:multisubunit Na+/H+ antiporter MnhE subunit